MNIKEQKKKYRIVEKIGKFYIQILHTRRRGIIYRRQVEEWMPVDVEGDALWCISTKNAIFSFFR